MTRFVDCNRPCHNTGIRPLLAHICCSTIRLFANTVGLGIQVLTVALLCPGSLIAEMVPVRFSEGAVHGFLTLRTVDGSVLGGGDLLQVGRGGKIESRMVFHLKDGSFFDERVVFTQQRVFTMHTYQLVQRGPLFPEDTQITLERATGKYRLKTKARKDAQDELLEGTLDLPPDVYNGMVLTIAKNLPKGASTIVHMVVFTPKPRLIELELAPLGQDHVVVGEVQRTATEYVFHPRLGIWLKFFATLLGRTPPDYHAWILTDNVPAFVRFEGPLYITGPIWRIEPTSPRFPK
jgi:hypothetical protein